MSGTETMLQHEDGPIGKVIARTAQAMTTRVRQILFLPLIGYAACGLVLSLALHVVSLAGFQPPGGNALFASLHCGVFPLVLALILISKMSPGTIDVKIDNWRLPFIPGCPARMNYVMRGLYIYVLVSFAFVFLMNHLATGTPTLSMSHFFREGDPSLASWRGFSSVWMVFYSFGLASLTTASLKGPENEA
jgi:hypothetical protein